MKRCVTHHYACECREKKFRALEKELAEARQIVNTERHKLIEKKYWCGINEGEERRLDFLQGKIKDWWPSVTTENIIRLDELMKGEE